MDLQNLVYDDLVHQIYLKNRCFNSEDLYGYKKELGEKVKRLRKRRGLTQEQLAELIEISPRNLSNIEQGITFAKAETLEKIVKSLNTSTQELFANDHIKTNSEFMQKINHYLVGIKDDNSKLELVYKILRDLLE